MTSIRDRDAGRDAENYDNDRKEGRYSVGGDRADWYPAKDVLDYRRGDAETQKAVDAALAVIEAAFGKWDRVQGRHIPHPAKPAATDWFAIATDITGAAK
jgi:hypothetical protein